MENGVLSYEEAMQHSPGTVTGAVLIRMTKRDNTPRGDRDAGEEILVSHYDAFRYVNDRKTAEFVRAEEKPKSKPREKPQPPKRTMADDMGAEHRAVESDHTDPASLRD